MAKIGRCRETFRWGARPPSHGCKPTTARTERRALPDGL